MKRKFITLLWVVSLFVVPVSSFAQENESETDTTESEISSFRGYEWGTLYDDVFNNEILTDMQEDIDYIIVDTDNNETGIQVIDGSVGGHSATISYIFSEGALTYGIYSLEIDEENYTDLLGKYTLVYGEPMVAEVETGWGPCAVWIDSENNYICMSGFIDSIIYASPECSYTEALSEMLSEYQGVDLLDLLNIANNMDGI